MAEARHVAHEKSEWRALTSEKDWCQVGEDVIGFESFAKLGQRHTFSPNVKAGSPNSPVYRQDDMFKNVLADAGSNLGSFTALGSGFTKITKCETNVIANGKRLAAHGHECVVNCNAAGVGGAKSKLMVEKKSVFSQMVNEAKMAAESAAVGILDAVSTGLNAVLNPWEEGDEARARVAAGTRGVADTAKTAATLVNDPTAAYVSDGFFGTNYTTSEQFKNHDAERATAAHKLSEPLQQGWNDAEQRNGTAGAISWLGTNAAIQIGIGALTDGALSSVKGVVSGAAKTAKIADAAATPKVATGGGGLYVKRGGKGPKPPPDGFKTYKTHGYTGDPGATPEGRRLVKEFEEQGYSPKDATDKARYLMETGVNPPLANPVEVGDRLYKVVPEGSMPGKNSEFWGTMEEIKALQQAGLDRDGIAAQLGVPLESQQTARFDVVEIKAVRPTTTFSSTIAPTSQNGWIQEGGRIQTLVTDRNAFTPPVKTGIKLP